MKGHPLDVLPRMAKSWTFDDSPFLRNERQNLKINFLFIVLFKGVLRNSVEIWFFIISQLSGLPLGNFRGQKRWLVTQLFYK